MSLSRIASSRNSPLYTSQIPIFRHITAPPSQIAKFAYFKSRTQSNWKEQIHESSSSRKPYLYALAAASVFGFSLLNSFPEKVPYVLVGGGTASYYAALTIRAYDPDAKVLIISSESETPYNRPPLSKELWLYGNDTSHETFEYIGVTGKKRDITYESDGFYLKPGELEKFEHGGISLIRNTFVTEIDPKEKEVVMSNGKKVKYDKLLIATGAKPQIPYPFYIPHLRNKVMTYYTAADFQKLYRIAKDSESILIYGNGPVASELAFSLQTKFGKEKLKVIQVFADEYPMKEKLTPNVGEFVQKAISGSGVVLKAQAEPITVNKLPNGQVEVVLEQNGEKIKVVVDHIVVAAGTEACTKIAESSGLRVDPTFGAIIANSKLQTSDPDIFVAGDVAAYDDPVTGRMRLETWENAQITGRLAGQNMTGHIKDFHHQASYSSLFGHNLHLYGVGQTDSSYETVSVFAPSDKDDPEYLRGVVFYLKKNKIVGLLLCNIFGIGIELGRKIIADGKEIEDFVELAKVFDIYLPSTTEPEEDAEELTSKVVPDPESPPLVVN